jgi:hypothetical protein
MSNKEVPKCQSIFGHNFRPRFDLGPADVSAFRTISAADPDFLEQLRTQTYVRDVCERCGHTIERNKPV